MKYVTVIWDPLTEANIRKMEMVQRRSARMVCSDYLRTSSVSSMLQQVQWSTLHKVTMMYRIVYHLVDVPTTYLIPISSIRCHCLNYLLQVKNAYHFCADWGSNPGRRIRNQTLYDVTVKAGLYSKTVQELINYSLPHIPTAFFDSFA